MKHLSRIDIEVIAEKIIKAYRKLPEVKNKKIYRIELELLLTKLFGLKIEYQHLSLDFPIKQKNGNDFLSLPLKN